VEFAEDLAVVFAEERGREAVEDGLLGGANGIGDAACGAECGVIDFDD